MPISLEHSIDFIEFHVKFQALNDNVIFNVCYTIELL